MMNNSPKEKRTSHNTPNATTPANQTEVNSYSYVAFSPRAGSWSPPSSYAGLGLFPMSSSTETPSPKQPSPSLFSDDNDDDVLLLSLPRPKEIKVLPPSPLSSCTFTEINLAHMTSALFSIPLKDLLPNLDEETLTNFLGKISGTNLRK